VQNETCNGFWVESLESLLEIMTRKNSFSTHGLDKLCMDGETTIELFLHPSGRKLTRGRVSHCGLAIYIEKVSLVGKRRITKTQIFHHAKNIIFTTSPKRNQSPSRDYNSIRTNLKFQHKPFWQE
jgi:hypothetical protein